MNRTELLKKLLPGFLPLFVFIAADEIWGTEVGLIVAVVFGMGQLVFTLIREKRLDKFVLFDTGLIIVLGLVSILLENEIFFKIKPALIGVILVAILGISAFTPHNFLLGMSKRYMKGIEMNQVQLKQMTTSIRIMFFIFLVHTALVFYSAFYMSKEAWAFISGGLFYILFGVYFAYEFIRTKLKVKKQQSEEWLPVVNEEGKVTGKMPRSSLHAGKKILHPVVHLHVINKSKQIYLQKRPADKLVQPDRWDTAVGGHLGLGENLDAGLRRETKEELGITEFEAKLIGRYRWESELEAELVFMFLTVYNGIISPDPDEVVEGRFWTVKEISASLRKGIFTPNFEAEFEILRKKKIV